MAQDLQTTMIRIADGEVGVREEGDNKGPRILEYMRSTWMPEESNQKGWPWCAAFVCWVITKACEELNLNKDDYVYLGADAFGWEKFARKKGWELLTEEEQAFPGDLIVFDFSHIGIVYADYETRIDTIEGNTGPDGGRDGDGVYRKERSPRTLVRHFIRLPWELPA